jgi:aspartate/tyrosine/aromatic aminotransferase
VQQRFYPYFNAENQNIDFDTMVEVLREAQKGDVIVLHACAHNPTGVDLSKEQWDNLATICKNTGLFPVFDLA